ncbi:HPr family phosphocarrier protein [Thalassorhabdus alkalitolerans]
MERQESLSLFRGLSVHKVVEFVHLNEQYDSDLFFEKKEKMANGKSILGMMSLLTTVRVGEIVNVKAKGDDADQLVNAIVTFVEQADLGEELLDYYEEEGVETVEKAMTSSLTCWSPDVRNLAKSYLKTTRH